MKLAVLFARSRHCHYCGIRVVLEQGRNNSATRDEIIPRSEGGTRTPDNVVMACFTCNNTRGNLPYAVFMAQVQVDGRPEPRSQPGYTRIKKLPKRPPREPSAAIDAILNDVQKPWGGKRMKAPKDPIPPTGIATLADAFEQAKRGK